MPGKRSHALEINNLGSWEELDGIQLLPDHACYREYIHLMDLLCLSWLNMLWYILVGAVSLDLLHFFPMKAY